MSNIKNRECVELHVQIDKSSAEKLNELLDLFKTEFDKPVFKYEVLDFLVYEFGKYTADFDKSQLIYKFLKFQQLDQYGENLK